MYKTILIFISVLMISGCATMQRGAEINLRKESNPQICAVWGNSSTPGYVKNAARIVAEERGLTKGQCIKSNASGLSNYKLCESILYQSMNEQVRSVLNDERDSRNLNCDDLQASIANDRAAAAQRKSDGYKALTEFGQRLSSQGQQLNPQAAGSNDYRGVYESDRVDGMNRICKYNRYGSAYLMTIPSHQLCPF